MISRLTFFLVFLIVLPMAGPVRAEASAFTSYDECILESLKGVSSDVAANAIIASCRSKFPGSAAAAEAAVPAAEPGAPPEPAAERVEPVETAPASKPAAAPSRALTPEELSKLKATLFGFTTKYTLTVENLNENIAITEVTIAVWDDLDPRGLKTYTETMYIRPSESGKVSYEVIYMGDDQGWRWKIDAAKGVPMIN